MILANLIDLIHLLLLTFPIYMFLLPFQYIKYFFKFIFLGMIMTPISWKIFGRCILSVATSSLNNNDETFSRRRMGVIYRPIMKSLGLDWNNKEDLDKARYFHKNQFDEPNYFEFSIESECYTSPEYLFYKAITVLDTKLQNLITNITDDTFSFEKVKNNLVHQIGFYENI